MARKETIEELSKGQGMTVGDLMEYIYRNNIDRNAKVFIQRVEDRYFKDDNDGEGWGVFESPCPMHQDSVNQPMDQYHPAWCCVGIKENGLFIDMHY